MEGRKFTWAHGFVVHRPSLGSPCVWPGGGVAMVEYVWKRGPMVRQEAETGLGPIRLPAEPPPGTDRAPMGPMPGSSLHPLPKYHQRRALGLTQLPDLRSRILFSSWGIAHVTPDERSEVATVWHLPWRGPGHRTVSKQHTRPPLLTSRPHLTTSIATRCSTEDAAQPVS